MTDLLHAMLGTSLAVAWLIGGAWVAIRSARISPLLEESWDPRRDTQKLRSTAHSAP